MRCVYLATGKFIALCACVCHPLNWGYQTKHFGHANNNNPVIAKILSWCGWYGVIFGTECLPACRPAVRFWCGNGCVDDKAFSIATMTNTAPLYARDTTWVSYGWFLRKFHFSPPQAPPPPLCAGAAANVRGSSKDIGEFGKRARLAHSQDCQSSAAFGCWLVGKGRMDEKEYLKKKKKWKHETRIESTYARLHTNTHTQTHTRTRKRKWFEWMCLFIHNAGSCAKGAKKNTPHPPKHLQAPPHCKHVHTRKNGVHIMFHERVECGARFFSYLFVMDGCVKICAVLNVWILR